MTVGLPGAGVGGIFYLLSALVMPLHASARWILCRSGLIAPSEKATRWGLIWRQFATAVGIIAGLWLTGWALAGLVLAHPTALGHLQSTRVGERLPNVLRVAAIMVSLGTLAGVLVAVQIARLVVRADAMRGDAARADAARADTAHVRSIHSDVVGIDAMRRDAMPAEPVRPLLRPAVGLVLMLLFSPAATAQAPASEVSARVAAGDSAYADGDTALARREYEAAIAIDPYASRALYRLGQLNSGRPRVANDFFRRYVAAEPTDAWGWMALGDSYATRGDLTRALASYDSAARIAPGERDAAIGRARVLGRAGRVDGSIVVYEAWTSSNEGDAEAWRELGDARRRAGRYREARGAYAAALAAEDVARNRQRLSLAKGLAAPTAEVQVDGSRDSDENQTSRARIAVGANAGDRMRVQLSASRRWITGLSAFGEPDFTVDEAAVGLTARPLAILRLEASGGVAVPRASGAGTAAGGIEESGKFVGAIRGTWRQPGGRGSVDLRATRILLDATPLLVQNGVTRTEVAGRADLPVMSRFSVRAGAKAGSYTSPLQNNTRLSLLGGVAVAATDAIEISGVFQRLTFANAAQVGYFAPRVAQSAEAGTYAEFETEGGTVLALDAGAGAQRFTEFGAAAGDWEPSFRVFASLAAPIRAGSELRLEVDTYDSRLSSDAATTGSWRFFSASAGVRLAFH